ncbi:MAG: efflux RND transporter periplasmic adaptor subunit [Paludibacter sp.]|nr:efflux RND transporter periplasmic adaptor subunit [Paludibacter sp.]
MKNILNRRYLIPLLFTIGGLFLGWLFFHSSGKKDIDPPAHTEHKEEIWTCSMHPQIKMDHPGKCPICAMDLIPLKTEITTEDSVSVHLSESAIHLANVVTSVVSKQKPVKQLRLYGKVQIDERLLQNQVAHIGGRIEKLMINFKGETVHKGQLLAVIYSPELVSTQQEFLEAAKIRNSQPEIYEAARQKLRQWLLSDMQINQIEKNGRVKTNFDIYANTSGVVTNRRVSTGDYVQQGAVLFELAGLSTVWVQFDAYESDLPFLKTGDLVRFTTQSVPGKTFRANIQFIDPVMDAASRVSRVRIAVNNADGRLKPEIFVTGIIDSQLDGMKDKLVIPRSAVLWTGKRSLVYLKTGEGQFASREIELGPALGNSYVVLSGLNEGDEIVTDGAFSIDAAAQLEGKPGMMEQ